MEADPYCNLKIKSAEIERLLRNLAEEFPHTRIVIEIGDGKIVKIEIAPRFVEKDFK